MNDLASGFDRNDPTTWQIAAPQISKPRSKSYSAYLQDSWKVTSYFTLNLGVRWELQDVQDRFNESAFKLDQNWAPRLGFVWDVTKNGKSKLYANWGRFYENIPQDINIRAFGGEVVCFCYNFSPNAADVLPDPSARALDASRRRRRRSTRTSRASTSTRPSAASSTRWRRTSSSAASSPTASSAA